MYAAIDVGSNTVRMLLGDVRQGRVVPKRYLRQICRLAGDYSAREGLSPRSMQRTLSALSEFAEVLSGEDVQGVKAIGTAAFRMAVNGTSFAQQIFDTTGPPLKIIDGLEEAQLMTAGVLSVLDPLPDLALIVDIGGGSTEFVLVNNGTVLWERSLSLGVVRLVEGCSTDLERQCCIAEQLSLLFDDMESFCDDAGRDLSRVAVVGTAGTVTTLAALDMAMTRYDWARVNNYRISTEKLHDWRARLGSLSALEREALPGMEQGRGDLIVAGLDLIGEVVQKLSTSHLTVSDFGILEGLLIASDNGLKLRSSD